MAEVGLKNEIGFFEEVKNVYMHFKQLKISIKNKNPCCCVFEAMKECNKRMEPLREKWMQRMKKTKKI